MPRSANSDRVKVWQSRLEAANKAYKKWSENFRCEELERFYEGDQKADSTAAHEYTINLFYSSIEAKKPALLFSRPKVRITPRPTKADDPQSAVDARARLLEDTAQTYVTLGDAGFGPETAMALHEAFFRFGVVEVGYSADFIDNPNAGRPVLIDEEEAVVDGKPVLQPDRVIAGESVYFRRIPAAQFRVPSTSRTRLDWNDWAAYYEWVPVEDVKRNPNFKNTTGLKRQGMARRDIRVESGDEEEQSKQGLVKLWKVWDLRGKKKYVLLDSWDKFLIDGEPFDYLPFAILRFHPRLSEYYPLPPTYQWLDPQRELNETREQQRIHRKRSNARFLAIEGRIQPEELQKLESGADGTYAWATQDNAIVPVPNPPQDSSIVRSAPQALMDFAQISNVSGETRGVAEAETATQASLMSSRLLVRESSERYVVAMWLSELVTILLKTLRDRMSLPFWIQTNVDMQSPQGMQEAMGVAQTLQQIKAADLGDFAFDVTIDLDSMSPVTEDHLRASWGQVLAMLTQPPLIMALLASEPLLRKTLSLYGIRDAKEISQIQQGMAAILGPMMAQGGAGTPASAGELGPGATPSAQQTGEQLAQQVPGMR